MIVDGQKREHALEVAQGGPFAAHWTALPKRHPTQRVTTCLLLAGGAQSAAPRPSASILCACVLRVLTARAWVRCAAEQGHVQKQAMIAARHDKSRQVIERHAQRQHTKAVARKQRAEELGCTFPRRTPCRAVARRSRSFALGCCVLQAELTASIVQISCGGSFARVLGPSSQAPAPADARGRRPELQPAHRGPSRRNLASRSAQCALSTP